MVATSIFVAGCGGKNLVHGNQPDVDHVLAVHVGIDTREQVSRLLGSPSTTGTFDRNTWYYVSKRTSQYAFFEPGIVDQEVLVVKFDDTGNVSDMYIHGIADGRVVEPIARRTPTYGQEMTVAQQLIYNFGRFNR
jgi:outer membrane protein assembly factor BamE (lipoprotein component of BamABCDE complex)